MRIAAGEDYVELTPETTFEVEQLKRLDVPRQNLTTELVERPGDSYPPTMQAGARLRIKIPQHDWGT